MSKFDDKSSGKGKKQEKSSEDEKILREKGDEGAKTREEEAVKNQREDETPIEEPSSDGDLGQNAENSGDSGGDSGDGSGNGGGSGGGNAFDEIFNTLFIVGVGALAIGVAGKIFGSKPDDDDDDGWISG